MHSSALYADLSHYYDLLCSNIDYKEHCQFVLRANRLWGNGGQRYLDLACGSGKLLTQVAEAGFECSGLDLSDSMLRLAAERCPTARLICADMSELDSANSFDLVSCFLYSIHYCASIAELEQTFRRVHAALRPGGLLCFDAVDRDSLANDQGYVHRVALPECLLGFQTRWSYGGTGDRMNLHIDIRESGDHGQRHYTECHAMTAVRIPTIQLLLEAAGFNVVILEHDFERLVAWHGSNGNVIFCATRPI